MVFAITMMGIGGTIGIMIVAMTTMTDHPVKTRQTPNMRLADSKKYYTGPGVR